MAYQVKKPRHKTVGDHYIESTQKTPDSLHVWDYVEAQAAEKFIPNLVEAVERGKAMFPNRDFFISNMGKTEELMPHVKREYWVPLNACPTPNFSQIVFQYKEKEEQLIEIWCIPPEDGCEYMIRNKNKVIPEEQNLLAYTIAFVEGRLDEMAKFLNGEKHDAPSIILQTFDNPPDLIV